MSQATAGSNPAFTARQGWGLFGLLALALLLWLFLSVWPEWLVAAIGPKKPFVNAVFNGVTVAGLYFLVASGFTLVFGLMRNVNLAHGSLYLLGAYIGYTVAQATGYWILGIAAGMLTMALARCRPPSLRLSSA